MARPRTANELRITVSVSLDPATLQRIDEARGNASRGRFIESLMAVDNPQPAARERQTPTPKAPETRGPCPHTGSTTTYSWGTTCDSCGRRVR